MNFLFRFLIFVENFSKKKKNEEKIIQKMAGKVNRSIWNRLQYYSTRFVFFIINFFFFFILDEN